MTHVNITIFNIIKSITKVFKEKKTRETIAICYLIIALPYIIMYN